MRLDSYLDAKDAITLPSGVIAVPYQVVERMQNDDQLATVLADNIAENLEKDSVRMVPVNRETFPAGLTRITQGLFDRPAVRPRFGSRSSSTSSIFNSSRADASACASCMTPATTSIRRHSPGGYSLRKKTSHCENQFWRSRHAPLRLKSCWGEPTRRTTPGEDFPERIRLSRVHPLVSYDS